MTARRGLVTAIVGYAALRVLGVVTLVALHGPARAHRLLIRWDAGWYAGIARDGYGATRVHPDGRLLSDYAFFPLYPGLEHVLHVLTGLRYSDAGLLVSASAGIAAAWALFLIGRDVASPRVGVLLALLWGSLPVAAVESMAYSESLFTALAAWSAYCVMRGRWLTAALLAVGAGLTRPIGAAVVVAVVVPAIVVLVRHGWRPRPLLALVLAPLGWWGYVGWVATRTGSWRGYFDVADGWGNGVDGGAAFARWTVDHLTGGQPWQGVLIVLGVLLLLVALAACFRMGLPLPLLLLVSVLVVLALTTSGYFGSKPRYLLPAFPLLLPPARWLAGRSRATVVALLVSLAASSAAYGAVWLDGTGPP